jgi:drug/metabolite transporter (DMT)-like permease
VSGLLGVVGARPRLAALLGAAGVSFSGGFYRLAHDSSTPPVSPETASFFRAFYGLPLLIIATFIERRRAGALSRRDQLTAAFAGVLFAGDLLLWHHSIDSVGAGLATVLGNLQVVIVALVAWWLYGERPTGRTLAALPIVLAGIVLIAGVIGSGSYGADPPLGAAQAIVCALFYSAYLIVIRQVSRSRTAEPIAISTATTAIVSLIAGLVLGTFDAIPSWPAHLWLILLGVSAQSLAYLLISYSLPRLPAVVTSIILLAQPVMAVLLAMAILGETPSAAQLAGVALVIGGIALATVPLSRLRRRFVQEMPTG